MNNEHYPRWQEQKIRQALRTRRVLLLAGARQCGITTLAKIVSADEGIYRTLDDETLLNAAQDDPQGFVRHNSRLMVIDEVQRAPSLIRAVKSDVDENQDTGRFLLTGSANIQSLPGVQESLAGRVRKARLRPLALGEIHQKEPQFIVNAFLQKFNSPALIEGKAFDKNAYISAAFRGGYPEALRLQALKEIRRWHLDYLEALLERDLKDITQVRRKDSMSKLVEVLAAWSSRLIDITSIGQNLAISRPTIESYINALEALYLVERVRSWHKTDYDRVGKKDKLFMTDTGLMASILGWRFDKVQLDGSLNGKLIESFVFTQLAAILDAQDEDYGLYHYRDREKREIDFLIEDEKGDMIALEVKAGSSVNRSSFKHMEWFREHLAKGREFTSIVLYTGENLVSFGSRMWAVPLSCLWS